MWERAEDFNGDKPSRRPRAILVGCTAALSLSAAQFAQAQGSNTYTYDALGRLSTETTDTGITTTYSYDAAGNRTQFTVSTTAPTAGPVSLSTAYGSAGSAPLAPGGVYSSVAIASSPSHGAASLSGTTLTYTPNSGYYGSDSLTYTASGQGGTSLPGTVSITVAPPPAPTVGNASLTVAAHAAGPVSLSPSGLYTSLAVSSGPAHGSASISGTTATYTSVVGYSGSDSFNYTATGPGGTSAPGTVSVTVTAVSLSVSLSATSWSWTQVQSRSPQVTSPITVTASGGAGGYTYAWQRVSGNTSQSAGSPTSSTTSFTSSPNPSPDGNTYTSYWRCMVKDSAGTVLYTPNVTVSFSHYNNG